MGLLLCYMGPKTALYVLFCAAVRRIQKHPGTLAPLVGGAVRLMLGFAIVVIMFVVVAALAGAGRPVLAGGWVIATAAIWILRAVAWAFTIRWTAPSLAGHPGRLALFTVAGLGLNLAFDLVVSALNSPGRGKPFFPSEDVRGFVSFVGRAPAPIQSE